MGYLVYFSGVIVCLIFSLFYIHLGYKKKTIQRQYRFATIPFSLFSWVVIVTLIMFIMAELIVNLFFKLIDKLNMLLDKTYGNED